MKKNLDTIKFEYRVEVQEILNAIDDYKEHCTNAKDNKSLMELYALLDAMDMSW